MGLQLLLNQAALLHQKGNLPEAEKLYRQVLEAENGNFQAWYLFAILRYHQQRGAEALEAAEAALKLNPGAAEALNLRGVLLQAAARREEALASFSDAVASKSDYAEAWYNRGLVLTDLQRPEEAVAAFDRVLAIQLNADAWNGRGVVLRALNRQTEALESFDRALAINPRHAGALNNRGSTLQDLKRFDEALASFDQALKIEPESAATLNNRGGALHGLKRLPEAVASYDRALEIKPDFAAALRNRAAVLQNLNYNVDSIDLLAASVASSQYAGRFMADARRANSDLDLLKYAVDNISIDGLILEFGVFEGRTVNHIADLLPGKQICGFDSFQGLPEKWRPGYEKGSFRKPDVPGVRGNVELVVGWFNDTLPAYCNLHRDEKVAFLHIDCDLYSSTKVIFDNLTGNIVPGTIIVFDEYFNYPNWEQHEFKAFRELVVRELLIFTLVEGLVVG